MSDLDEIPQAARAPGSTAFAPRIWLVSRHLGAVTWLQNHLSCGTTAQVHRVAHLELVDVSPGDTVVGTLPINMVADIVACGGHYWHLVVRVPQHLRGCELSAAALDEVGAELVPYRAERLVVSDHD